MALIYRMDILPEIIEGSRSFFEVVKYKVTNKMDVFKLTKVKPFGCKILAISFFGLFLSFIFLSPLKLLRRKSSLN